MEYLAWPTVVVVLVLAFLLMFKRQVGGFIERAKSFKAPGIHAEAQDLPQVQSQGRTGERALIGGPEQLGTPLNDEVLSPMDQEYHRLIQASVPDEQNHLPWALRLLSHITLQRDHEVTARLIFDSQLQALRAIAQSGGILDEARIKSHYDLAASAYPDAYVDFSLERWLNFLIQRRVVSREMNGICITAVGRNYLAYVAAAGLRDPSGL